MPTRKNSKKRQVILEALAATTAHPTAQELYQQLKPDYPDLSLGTVYRNLSLFSKQGDVMSVGVFRGQERFDARTEPHAHLHCAQCRWAWGSVRASNRSCPRNTPTLITSPCLENRLRFRYTVPRLRSG